MALEQPNNRAGTASGSQTVRPAPAPVDDGLQEATYSKAERKAFEG